MFSILRYTACYAVQYFSDSVRCGEVRFGEARSEMVRSGEAWLGKVWCGKVWVLCFIRGGMRCVQLI